MSLLGMLQCVGHAPETAFFIPDILPQPSPTSHPHCLRSPCVLPAVRVGYPCFGNPKKNNQGKIVGYPAYGRWRVHNLYVSIWQKVTTSDGRVKPYDVVEVYRY
jgi:hypothetical protein